METHGRPFRRKDWDYARSGVYFVTFVVARRRPLLRDSRGKLTKAGQAVLGVWNRLPELNPRVALDSIVVMADHVHAMLLLRDHPADRAPLGTVIRRWKAASTRVIHEYLPGFKWQSHFHDWVVRDQSALNRVRRYIQENGTRTG
jgi:REP element-mobilizing transposase RayT